MERERIQTQTPAAGELSIVELLINEVSKVPLLNKAQEVSLFRRIESGKRASKKILSANGNLARAEGETLNMLVADAAAAEEHVYLANLRLVISVAKKYTPPWVELLDSIQSGATGLTKAIDKFDLKRGTKFSTCATWWIRNAVQRDVANFGRTIRIPTNMQTRLNRILKTAARLTQEFGREPSTQELSVAMSIRVKTVRTLLDANRRPLSLELPVGESGESSLGDFIPADERRTPHEQTDKALMSQQVNLLLKVLTPREEKVVRMRFGLDDGRGQTLEQIGGKMGVTRERIRQIEQIALSKIRPEAQLMGLSEFLLT